MSAPTAPTAVRVVAQVRHLSSLGVTYQQTIAAGATVAIVPASTLAADIAIAQAPGSSQNVELSFQPDTPWGKGFPLAGGLTISGFVGAIYAMCDPAASAAADVRAIQTRAIAQTQAV